MEEECDYEEGEEEEDMEEDECVEAADFAKAGPH